MKMGRLVKIFGSHRPSFLRWIKNKIKKAQIKRNKKKQIKKIKIKRG